MHYGYGYFEEEKLGKVRDIRLWKRIFAYIRPHWRGVALSVALALLITASGLVLPYLIQVGIDDYITDTGLDMDTRISGLTRLAFIFLGIAIFGFLANFFQVVVLEWSGQRIMHSLRRHTFDHLLTLNLSYFNSNPVGKLVTRVTNDIQNMHEMFTSVIVTLFNEAIRLIGILAILFWMNWRLTLMLSIIFPVMVVITNIFGKLSRDSFRSLRTQLARINAYIQEAISGIAVIQLFLREKDTGERFVDLNWSHYRAAMNQIKLFGIFTPIIDQMSYLSMALIIWYGGVQILDGNMTIGMLVAFISYMRQFFQPIRELSQKYTIVQSAMASAERIFQLIETRDVLPAPQSPVVPNELRGEIKFRDVTFGYDAGRPVINGLNFHIRPGETLAIVGATGAGKTTIINLLERFYDPDGGEILLDGMDLRMLDTRRLREQIGLIMQDVFIIPGSVRENILLDKNLSEDELRGVIERSQLSSLVERLPDGLETRIGEGGIDLSAGQRQLLAFARVLARDPRILILDEATASIDTETEMLVEQAVQATLAHRTNIVIAHRLSTIRRADRIFVMAHGRIVERGAHDSLMARQGLYYRLQMLQNGAHGDNFPPHSPPSAPPSLGGGDA